MIKIIHRINKSSELKKVDPKFGVEIDLREFGNKIVLHHDPFAKGESFENYLKSYKHSFIILNIKETGIEKRVLELVHKHGIKDYFLLDVEHPYIYRARMRGERKIAIRYSEVEPIEAALLYKNKMDWVWVDVCTKLPLNKEIVKKLKPFKACLVSPECWGRPSDIIPYQKQMRRLGFMPDAVMADPEVMHLWEQFELQNNKR